MRMRPRWGALVALASIMLAAALIAQEHSSPAIRKLPVTDNMWVLDGVGGEVLLQTGDDGTLLVDSGMPEFADKLGAAIKADAKAPIRFIINTHWHFDHVGGNKKLAGSGVTILAHENVRKRMSSEQYIANIDQKVPASPAEALPAITYAESMTLYCNGDEVQIIHLEPAHTDGDSLVYFRKANVLHAGDIYFAGEYPFIDVRAGGSIDGMIKAVERAAAVANDKTKIVPGHGPVSTLSDLRAYGEMLKTARDSVRTLVQQGKSREDVIAAKPTRELDKKWGHEAFPPDMWVGIIYDGMTRK